MLKTYIYLIHITPYCYFVVLIEIICRRRRMNAVPPADTMSLWSEEECRAFETGLRVYGKDFYSIKNQKVGTRAVGELVQFYYLWKKTERHDVFANSFRLGVNIYFCMARTFIISLSGYEAAVLSWSLLYCSAFKFWLNLA